MFVLVHSLVISLDIFHRYIKWDCVSEEWTENSLLSSERTDHSCPAACVTGNGQVAVGVDNPDGGSDVFVIALSTEERYVMRGLVKLGGKGWHVSCISN